MPLPRWIARVNLLVTNRILGPIAKWAPGMAIVIHTGRKSHREYHTPVMVFRRGNQFVIALTYGREAQWVQNVLAAKGCQLETGGRTVQLAEARIFHDDERQHMPGFVRLFLGILNVSDFLELTVDRDTASE